MTRLELRVFFQPQIALCSTPGDSAQDWVVIAVLMDELWGLSQRTATGSKE